MLCISALSLTLAATPGWADVPEVEPNESKATATPALLAPGEALTGVATGLATVNADYFRVSTSVLPGITLYRLTITTKGPEGHALSIRGLQQSGGVIGAADVSLQTSTVATSPSRHVAWYGLGPGDPQVYVRVLGSSQTTGAYRVTLSAQSVLPQALPGGPLPPGTVTITTRNQGHSTDTDLWVYDWQLRPIAGFGNDDTPGFTSPAHSTLTRTFAPGRYTLAISDTNMANNLASPPEDARLTGSVTDFGSVIVCAQPGSGTNLTTAFTTAAGTRQVAITKPGAFQAVFVEFTVGAGGCNPSDIASEGNPDPGAGPDGFVTGVDFDVYVFAYFTEFRTSTGVLLADITDGGGSGGPDGFVTGTDFDRFVELYFAGCG